MKKTLLPTALFLVLASASSVLDAAGPVEQCYETYTVLLCAPSGYYGGGVWGEKDVCIADFTSGEMVCQGHCDSGHMFCSGDGVTILFLDPGPSGYQKEFAFGGCGNILYGVECVANDFEHIKEYECVCKGDETGFPCDAINTPKPCP